MNCKMCIHSVADSNPQRRGNDPRRCACPGIGHYEPIYGPGERCEAFEQRGA